MALSCLVLDQVSKFWVTAAFRPGESLSVVQNYFSISLKHNPGAAFGLFRGRPLYFFLGTSFFAMAFILYFVLRIPGDRVRLSGALSLILGGAMGNISDRLRLGAVVDFLDLHYHHHMIWPTFNLADMAIVAGVFLFLWDISKKGLYLEIHPLRQKKRNEETGVPSPGPGEEEKAPG